MRTSLPKLLILLAAAACSSSDGDAPGGADAGPGSTPTAIGLINVASGASGTRGTAFFSHSTGALSPDLCQTSTVGSCEVQSCPASTDSDGQRASAGTLTISGGDQAVVLEPSADLDGDYDVTSGDGAGFADGATVAVHASGAAVPTFSSPAVKMPEAIIVSGDMPSIDFTKDFPVAWADGGPDGKVVVEILTDGGSRTGHLTCRFDPTLHQAIVPKEALALLPDCPGSQVCVWTVQPESTVHFQAGDYEVDFTMIGDGEAGMFQQHH